MLKERMERVQSLLVERLTDGMDFVELGQIKEKGIAPLLTQWLTAQAKASLEREQKRRADTGLSYDHPRVKVILERLDDTLLDVTMFPKAEIEQVVAEQIRWETMLRIRPLEAMVQFFLPKEGTLSVAELVEAFPKLPVQAFYGEGIKAYAAEHAEDVMDRETLVGVLQGIENKELATDAVEVVINAAATTLEFLKQRHVEDGDEIDLDIIERILNYYRMEDQARVIKVEQMLGRERLTLGQVRRILEMTGDLDEAGEAETETWSLETGEEIGGMEEGERENEGEKTVGDEPEEARKGEGEAIEISKKAEVSSAGLEDKRGKGSALKDESKKDSGFEDKTKKDSGLEDKTRKASGLEGGSEEVLDVVERPGGVFKKLNDKEERYYIRKLFAKHRGIYELLMKQLEGISVWEEAYKTIQKFWKDHPGLDAHSKAAERFTSAIYDWYADESS